jgi:hypothetical protein
MLRLACLVLLLVARPVAAQTTAPVDGDAVGAFAGEWIGGYASEATGRHGTLVFRLVVGTDSVRAVVVMTPRATADVLVPEGVALAVHHVTIDGRELRGVLARYDDPEWHLPLETSFVGTLVGDDRIEGVFEAVGTQIDTVPQDGQWWATRVPGGPLARN